MTFQATRLSPPSKSVVNLAETHSCWDAGCCLVTFRPGQDLLHWRVRAGEVHLCSSAASSGSCPVRGCRSAQNHPRSKVYTHREYLLLDQLVELEKKTMSFFRLKACLFLPAISVGPIKDIPSLQTLPTTAYWNPSEMAQVLPLRSKTDGHYRSFFLPPPQPLGSIPPSYPSCWY